MNNVDLDLKSHAQPQISPGEAETPLGLFIVAWPPKLETALLDTSKQAKRT